MSAEVRERIVREHCQSAMSAQHFSSDRRKEWMIWGSIHRPCPKCKQGKGMRCLNMLKLKKGDHVGVQWPHDQRIDWPKILEGLKKRGYAS